MIKRNNKDSKTYLGNLVNKEFSEIMDGLRSSSSLMILDFNQIDKNLPDYANIKLFFENAQKSGINPKLPEQRQAFNDKFLEKSGKRYLIGRYLEDRKEMLKGSQIEKEGRTIHLGIDLFSKNLEPLFSPEDGKIVVVGKEQGPHSYGNYIIMKHNTKGITWYSFFGHLSDNLPPLKKVKKGEKIATLGDYKNNENGGWSRHVHYQILLDLPEKGKTPIGYSTIENLEINKTKFPNPNIILKLKELQE